MRHVARSAAAVTTLLLLACGGSGEPSDRAREPASTQTEPSRPFRVRHPLCASLRSRVTGHIATADATELSGLVLSRTQRRVLWTHNDSGDRARIFAVSPGGRLLAELTIEGAENVDWEDIAVGPAAGAGDALYIGDIGDNAEQRAEIVVYRIAEPRVAGGGGRLTALAERLTLRYPDSPHDAEALLADPSSGALVVVTKTIVGPSRVYVADRPSAGLTTTMRRAGTVPAGRNGLITAGDVSADGRTIVVRTYARALAWSRRRGESLASAMRRRPCVVGAGLFEGQSEALALTRDGRAFYTVPEGADPALRLYAAPGGPSPTIVTRR